jgi:hypothetical protein
MTSNKFENYFKSNELSINKNVINKYITLDSVDDAMKDSKSFVVLSNGYSIVKVLKKSVELLDNFEDLANDSSDSATFIKDSILRYVNLFMNNYNYNYEVLNVYSLKEFKEGIYVTPSGLKKFRINEDYNVNVTLFNKIVSIIGCNGVRIIKRDLSYNVRYIIEIFGKYNQVGYLLPERVY